MAKTIEAQKVEADHKYDLFEGLVKITALTKMQGQPVFVADVDTERLWDLYLTNLPYDGQHYNCNCCKSFIKKYGALVTIDELSGETTSVLWANAIDMPEFFKKSVAKMKVIVENSPVKKVFFAEGKTLGNEMTGEWSHLHCSVPDHVIHQSSTKSAGQAMAEKKEEFRIFKSALDMFATHTIEKTQEILSSGVLYRGERFTDMVSWFANADRICSNDNLIWRFVASAPPGFTRIKNTVIGSFMEDIQEGLSIDAAKTRFDEKMNPANYMRLESAPTAGAIAEAEKLIEQLGLAPSLERRYARLDELPKEKFIWENKYKKPENPVKTGVFANIAPKEKTAPISEETLPKTKMTWAKFLRTVLPSATNIEAKLDNTNRLMALVTENNSGSENIMKWNNPFSWYYHGGVDGEIRKRVEEAGGRYEGNDIRCSLIWENYTDLDLHCKFKSTYHGSGTQRIYYGNKSNFGGRLDVDRNVHPETKTPVENIRFETGRASNGHYKFEVNNYTNRSDYQGNPFKVELEVNGNIYSYQGDLRTSGGTETAFEFDYVDGNITNLKAGNANSTVQSSWSLPVNSFAKVTGIVYSPDTWDMFTTDDSHIFFLIEGLQDMSEGRGRGFFNEHLKSDLKPIRKTLEAYSAQAPILGTEEATACGLGFNGQSDWNLTLKVQTGTLTRLIEIDRLD